MSGLAVGMPDWPSWWSTIWRYGVKFTNFLWCNWNIEFWTHLDESSLYLTNVYGGIHALSDIHNYVCSQHLKQSKYITLIDNFHNFQYINNEQKHVINTSKFVKIIDNQKYIESFIWTARQISMGGLFFYLFCNKIIFALKWDKKSWVKFLDKESQRDFPLKISTKVGYFIP